MQRTRLDSVRVTRLVRERDGWLLSFRCADRVCFEEAIALLRDLPRMQREYLPAARAWWVAAFPQWLTDAWPALAEALRAYDRTSSHRSSNNHSNHSSARERFEHARSGTLAPAIAAAFATLCLTPAAPPELVSAARRIWARHYHPDHGGDAARMKAANNAADVALRYAEQQSTAH